MLAFDKLSYWEKVTYFQDINFLVVGSGIIGLSTALSLKKRFKDAKILVVERGYLPTGASTKNAGFACFGSPSELLSDLALMGEEKTASLLKLRWEGLQMLLETVESETMSYKNCGSYDLFLSNEKDAFVDVVDKLAYLNQFIEYQLGLTECFSVSQKPQNQGMQNLTGSIFNRYEGSIDTGKMMHRLIQLIYEQGISILGGMDVLGFREEGACVHVQTQFGDITTGQLFICTNGLSQKLLPNLDLKPARAQVVVTSPLPKLALDSTYHYDSGYYYFRKVEQNRLLIGGGRNLDFLGETTEEMEVTTKIKGHIVQLLKQVIIPDQQFEIDYAWAGIMGVGLEKMPIIESVSSRVHCAVRMGGMGIAMGRAIGERLSELAKKM